jgi:signal transduction histidine kinase
MPRKRVALLLAGASVAFGLVAEAAVYDLDQPGRWVPDLVTGWTLVGCGLACWVWRPGSPSGGLLALTGVTWFFGNFDAVLVYVHRGPLVHLLLAHPSGRAPRVLVGAGYLIAVIPGLWGSEPASIVLAALLFVAALAIHRPAAGRAHVVVLGATAVLCVVVIGGAVARLAVTYGAETPALLAYELGLCAVAALITRDLLARAGEQAALVDLVVELARGRSGTLQQALAEALGDPTVEVVFRLPDTGGFVDAAGRPAALPDPASGRTVTFIEREGHSAAVVHDPAVLEDASLVDALGTATALAATNARLQAAVRVQVDELAASAGRLVDARDAQRRQLERRLREGAEQRLQAIGDRLKGVDGARAEQAREQLSEALAELRELAAGLHPRALTEEGLEGAVRGLAARSSVPVEVVVEVGPLAGAVESAAYFVCAEALANLAKHAGASRAAIEIGDTGGRLLLRVSDDGAGGADPDTGTGLRGLADRVEALGGSLHLESPPGAGTRLTVEIPLSRSSRMGWHRTARG